MEQLDTRGGFEKFLRESTDQFRMVPSRRVWYSIYNNMHPDRKWPSITVCLLILSAIMYLGVANNNHLSDNAREHNRITALLAQEEKIEKAEAQLRRSEQVRKQRSVQLAVQNPVLNTILFPSEEAVPVEPAEATVIADEYVDAENKNFNFRRSVKSNTTATKTSIGMSVGLADSDLNIGNGPKTPATPSLALAKESSKTQSLFEERELRSQIEDFAFKNKPKPRVRKLAGLGYYFTPSFGYRNFEKNIDDKTGIIASPKLRDAAALNLELGIVLRYAANSNVILKTGAQLNYTNYVSKASYLSQPVQTNVAADPNRSATSTFAVGAGISKLNKSTLQVSLPLGIDFRVAGRGKLKWYAGTSLQPTYVISGNAFVLSKDAKHYVSETDLLRRVNMNASFETFLSFKPSSGIGFNVGPQFRYQLLSTYKQSYNYSEKLYNFGVKIGITTGL